MKVYEITFNLPTIWHEDSTSRQVQYNEITETFAQWANAAQESPLFELKELDPNERYFSPVTQLRSTVTDDELLAVQENDKLRAAIKSVKLVHQDIAKQVEQVAGPRHATPEQSFNQRVEVHIPGNALTVYNKTQLLEDCCTDHLQEELDQGWRIIAVCPQPDQRRPDYILGRYEPCR